MIAICSMIKKPLNFKTWIDYHLSIGIKYFFLRIEETPELEKITSLYPDNIFPEFINQVDKKDNYWTIIDRQNFFITNAIEMSKQLSVNWLLHIDCDELLWTKEPLNKFLSEISSQYSNVLINNFEAVYPDDSLENPFLQTNHFLMTGLAYANGKSFGRVSESLTCNGPHGFGGLSIKIERRLAVILHFESATFDSWYSKFLERSDTTEEKFNKIPFQFYKDSISLIRKGNIEKCREYYNSMKVEPYYSDRVLKLFWTPLLEEKNSHWLR